ncbi:MAG TPA: DUF721 domain-containing protein [Prosthecobacter sp.]
MSNRLPTAAQRRRHALISAWRGMDPGPVLNNPLQSVADLVGPIVAQAGVGDRMKLEEVLGAWKEIVGDFLFQHSKPDSIQRGVLMVRVLQPTVHHALMMERPRILKRLKEKLKNSGIKDVRLKHG